MQNNDFGSFKWLTGDVNYTEYGGKWCRKIGPGRYHVITLDRWSEMVGKREAKNRDMDTYNVSLSEVDLKTISEELSDDRTVLHHALKSCGWYYDSKRGVVDEHSHDLVAPNGPVAELVCVEACHGYGAKAPLEEYNGNNWRKLMQEARAYSRELTSDNEKMQEALDRPVNAIGTSAKDYMLGKMLSWR
jgi:hypothetical protein